MKRILMLFICFLLTQTLTGCNREREVTGVAVPKTSQMDNATAVLATIADEDVPPPGIAGHGETPALEGQQAIFPVVFSEMARGVAYLVGRGNKVAVVKNGNRGREYSSVGTIVLSPDGRRIAYGALSGEKWRMVVDGKEGRAYDTVLTPIFSPDSQHVAYQAKEGDKWYVVVDNRPNAGTIASYTTPEFSSDSKLIAYVEAADSNVDMKLIVSDLSFGKQHVRKSIGDLLFTTNKDRTRIAAAQAVDNKVRIIDFDFSKPDIVREGPFYDTIELLTLSDDGKSVSYGALRGQKRLIVLDNREATFPDGSLQQLPVIRPDKTGVGLLVISQNRSYFHQAFHKGKEKGNRYDEASDLVFGRDSSRYAYAARRGKEWFVVVNGLEGPAFDRVVSPVFSPDGKRLVYRARKDGKRFLVVADADGRTLLQHPSYEQVFQPVFTSDGNSVVYGVKDGNKLMRKVEKLD